MAFDFSEFGNIESLAKIGVEKMLNDNLQNLKSDKARLKDEALKLLNDPFNSNAFLQTAIKLHETQNAINKILNQLDGLKKAKD
ncbi:hypothetical protein [Campylobacter mucosalis]|uniref:Uncharacterized protein n=1 Tax=Campylobacter mucosalis CCUG 21559 TaxID=1032067 RepID=A0A6G5QFL7_9BACT|nr:hypothetical protein [Campylobacter mucosalis]QCD44468.1 hypothetical protein CMUC_0669 [Campylobacter mucosalis CCUG 21559]